ncbi:MAG TPA: hypothetical protein VJT15_04630, partial [Pyrinomonadaceae bacterium]|nr:hypothetical protein [Pyrinomonadaceae bacterium]
PAIAGGNNFQKWQRNGVDWSTNRTTSVTMDANYTLTAVYVTPTRTLSVGSSNPATGVSISVTPVDNSALGSGATQFNRTYNQNTNVTLTAPTTAGGNNFQKWQRNGVDWSTNRSTSVTMDANHTMTAVYVTPIRTLTAVSSNPNSGVSITVSPNDNANLGSGATPFNRTYNHNTIVTLTAPLTAGGHTFHKWQRNGVDFSINPAINLTMNGDYTMTAVYGTRRLTVASNPNNGVNITVSPTDTGNLGSGPTQFTRIYNLNTTVTLTTPATAGVNIFQKWQRNGVDFSTIRSISVTMDNDYNLMAVYVSPPAPVQTLTVAGNDSLEPRMEGPVSITVSPNDNNNLGNGTTQFSRSYNHNTTVTLTAPSSPVTPFRKWQRNGLDWSTNPTTTVTMDSNYTMTAVYGGPFAMRTLNVASTNPNSGVNINLFPHDANNQGVGATQFSRRYFSSSAVTLVAPATVGLNTFQKWQRDGVDFSTNRIVDVRLEPFTVNMTAVYVSPPTQTLTVASSNPSGGVNITVSPNDNSNQGSGPTQFTRTYNPNTTVTLTAPATVGLNTFQKWQRNGVDWSTNPATSVTLDANYTMTAVYGTPPAPTRTLTITSINPNSGVSITANPTDNNNQGGGTTQLTRTYNHNTNVMLTAPSMVGNNQFLQWLRDGVKWSNNTLTSVLMDGDYTMTAVYVPLVRQPRFVQDPVSAAGSFSSDWTTSAEPSILDWIGLFRTDGRAEASGVRTFTNPDRCEVNALCRALRVGSRSLYAFY